VSQTEQVDFLVEKDAVLAAGAGGLQVQVVALPERRGSLRERLVHSLSEAVANLVVQKPRSERLRFGLVREPEELAAVGRMRLRVYQAKLPYLLQELSADGTDAYDAHSFVFAAWRGDKVVATVRATRYPYETLRYVPEQEFSQWLQDGWNTDYLEWGRLLVDTSEGLNRVTPALITYAGLHLHWLTPYRKAFGHTRPHAKRSFDLFRMDVSSLTFRIPHRGEHSYLLVKGDLLNNVIFAVPRWLGALGRAMLGGPRRASWGEEERGKRERA
jgi:hypothetical protein